MNNTLPALLHCPNCENRRDSVSLGSVTTEGYFIIKRKFGRQMMVMATEYSVICDCGYLVRFAEGKILSDQNPNIYVEKD